MKARHCLAAAAVALLGIASFAAITLLAACDGCSAVGRHEAGFGSAGVTVVATPRS